MYFSINKIQGWFKMTAEPSGNTGPVQDKIATQLVTTGIWAVGAIGIVVMLAAAYSASNEQAEPVLRNAEQILVTGILPLIGTWVGTVLAFYYSKQNYETASKSALDFARTSDPRLGARKVSDVGAMILPRNISAFNLGPDGTLDGIKVQDLYDKFWPASPDATALPRLPVFNANGSCAAIVHSSYLSEMIAKLYSKQADVPPKLSDLTMSDLYKAICPDQAKNIYKAAFEESLAFVSKEDSVATAKKAMENKSVCQDVFVTATGQSTEPVLGWLPNTRIAELSKA